MCLLTGEMKDKLGSRVRDNTQNLSKLLTELEAPEYNEPMVLASDKVLQHLNDVEKRLKLLDADGLMFAEFAGTVGSEKPSNEVLQQATEHFQQRRIVWECLDSWTQKQRGWQHTASFLEIDCKQAERDVVEFYKKVSDLWRVNKEDSVVQHMKKSIEDFRQYVPMMVELGDEAMKGPGPWCKVFSLLSLAPHSLHQDTLDGEIPQFSLAELIQWKVFDVSMREKIEEICTVAGILQTCQPTCAQLAL